MKKVFLSQSLIYPPLVSDLECMFLTFPLDCLHLYKISHKDPEEYITCWCLNLTSHKLMNFTGCLWPDTQRQQAQ